MKMRVFGIRIEVSPYLLILLAAAIFFLPVRWLTAMLIAAAAPGPAQAQKNSCFKVSGFTQIRAPFKLRVSFSIGIPDW